MRVEEGEVKGDLSVTDQLDLRGVVSGTVTVAAGGGLSLRGACGGSVIVEPGGTATIHGAVAGDAVNRGGELNLHGLVVGALRADQGQTFLSAGSKVMGGLHGAVIVACGGCGQRLNVPADRGDLNLKCPKCQQSWAWSPAQYRTAEVDVLLNSATAGKQAAPPTQSRAEQADRIVGLLWRIYSALLGIALLLGALLLTLLLK